MEEGTETGFIVLYVGRESDGNIQFPRESIPRYNIGERLIVTKVSVSSNTGTTYYAVTDGRTKGAWYDAELFKRLDEIRAERLDEIGI
jgi:hypothetical protein